MTQGATALLRPSLQQYSAGWYAAQTAPCSDVSCQQKHGHASGKSGAPRTSSVTSHAILSDSAAAHRNASQIGNCPSLLLGTSKMISRSSSQKAFSFTVGPIFLCPLARRASLE